MNFLNQSINSKLSSTSRYCVNLVKEVNELIDKVTKKTKESKSVEKYTNPLPLEFINAIENLSLRIKSNKKLNTSPGSRQTSKKLDKIGPGYYDILKPSTPVVTSATTKINFDVSKRVKLSQTPNFIKKNKKVEKNSSFSKEHNLRVAKSLENRKQLFQISSKQNRSKFIQKIKHKNFLNSKEIKNLVIEFFVLGSFYSLQAILRKKYLYFKNLRDKSVKLHKWFRVTVIVLGKLARKLRNVRNRIRNKNILGLAQPVVRMVNLISLNFGQIVEQALVKKPFTFFMFKWMSNIRKVQKRFREYKSIKEARIRGLILVNKKYRGLDMDGCERDKENIRKIELFLLKILNDFIRKGSVQEESVRIKPLRKMYTKSKNVQNRMSSGIPRLGLFLKKTEIIKFFIMSINGHCKKSNLKQEKNQGKSVKFKETE